MISLPQHLADAGRRFLSDSGYLSKLIDRSGKTRSQTAEVIEQTSRSILSDPRQGLKHPQLPGAQSLCFLNSIGGRFGKMNPGKLPAGIQKQLSRFLRSRGTKDIQIENQT